MTALVTRTDVVLRPDPGRVLARLFVPGHEQLTDRRARGTGVLARILALPEDEVVQTLAGVRARHAGRHRDLQAVLDEHYAQIAHRVPDLAPLSADRRSLLGACFTLESSLEGAALFNPSAVPHPDQGGLPEGALRFVLSLRAVGEGHLSCVEFRTGTLGPGPQLALDDPGEHVEGGRHLPAAYDRALFVALLVDAGADDESADHLAQALPDPVTLPELERVLADLLAQRATRSGALATVELARRVAAGAYDVVFAPETTLAERVLWPHSPSESQGIEDARLVRLVHADGTAGYRGTYTAFDGAAIEPQLIETDDFRTFRMSQLTGPAARDKGMALFPRTVGGRYVALSRSDRQSSGVSFSPDGRSWGEPVRVHGPVQPWELIQTGNCGSPVETEAGWVVLTHGVGPMREYAIGAVLLDLDDPTRVLGGLREPLLRPADDEREGYVPNVVYSCGALLHGGSLLLPYGVSDAAVRFAFVDVPELLDRLTADGPPATTRSNSAA